MQRTIIWVSTVALSFDCEVIILENFSIVSAYDPFHVCHSTVANLDVVSVEQFPKSMSQREMSVNELQELLSYFGFYIFTIWGIEPKDFALTIFPS